MELFDKQTKELLEDRIETRYGQGRMAGVYQLGEYYSPERIIEEIKRGTPAGEQFLFAEKKLMDEVKKRM